MNHRVRLIIIAAFIFAWAGLLFSRLYTLQIQRHDEFLERARQQHLRPIKLTPKRGTIYDSRGKILAINVNAPSIYIDPAEVESPDEVIQALSSVLGEPEDEIRELVERDARFVWVKRKAEPEQWQELKQLNLKGVSSVTESQRLYPGGSLASHVLGFVNIDNAGQGGVEYSYDRYLKGKPGLMLGLKGGKQGYQFGEGNILEQPTGGNNVHLTIDSRIQQIVEEELNLQWQNTEAESATVIVMDPSTGAIKAMASMPDYDPNSRFTSNQRFARKNRAVVDAYEPGSTFKIITAAAAFEQGVVDPGDTFDCEMGSITIGNRTIRDHNPFGVLTFREVIAHSSNVGTIKVAELVGERPLWDMAHRFGYGQGTGIDLPGENDGILRKPEDWTYSSYASISIGQEVSGNPVQIALNAAIIANGGYWVRPHVVERVTDAEGATVYTASVERRKILSDDVVDAVKPLMREVVTSGGGKSAALPGIQVAGKTGTGEIAEPGEGYISGAYLSSFLGFFPYESPQLVVFCTIVKPVGPYYGGQIGAPLFKRISNRIAHVLNLQRQDQEIIRPPIDTIIANLTQPARPPDLPSETRTLPDLQGALLMPDFSGVHLKDAIQLLVKRGVVPVVQGSGRVVFQFPEPGETIAGEVVLRGNMAEGTDGTEFAIDGSQ